MNEAGPVIVLKRRYVYEDVDRWGNVRIYFWRGQGQRKFRCTQKPGTEAFDRVYHDWLNQSEVGAFKSAPRDAPLKGTFRWLAIEHFGSVAFKQLDPRTQHVTRLIVEKMFVEPIAPGAEELFGDCPIERFDARAVRILRDRKADKRDAANNRVKRLRRIFAWALENGIPGVTVNPARDVPLLKPKRVGGFPTWTSTDIERFEKRHPIGSKARLALALLIYTGVRRSDVVSLGRQHVRNGRLVFRPHKGRNRSPLTLELPVLPALQSVIEKSPTGDLSFLVTELGKPFTAAGFTNWFRDRCNEAELAGLSAHGLRKAASTRAAENGATAHELMAIFGWQTIKEAEAYTRAAERKRLASGAMHLLGTKSVEIFPTSEGQGSQVGKKEGKR
jgi:integrase